MIAPVVDLDDYRCRRDELIRDLGHKLDRLDEEIAEWAVEYLVRIGPLLDGGDAA